MFKRGQKVIWQTQVYKFEAIILNKEGSNTYKIKLIKSIIPSSVKLPYSHYTDEKYLKLIEKQSFIVTNPINMPESE